MARPTKTAAVRLAAIGKRLKVADHQTVKHRRKARAEMSAARGISRRSLVTGALIGGAGGILSTTVVHAGAHAMAGHEADHEAAHVDIGFCIDMSTHHVQAIGMCERVLGRETGGAVQSAATEVIRNQSIEVGMMRAWLTDWGASTAPPTMVMGWMSMTGEMNDTDMDDAGIPLSDMPGYATGAQMLALSQAEDGVPKGRMWLELMRAHHVGGVLMAEAAVELAEDAKVIRLARTQSEVQAFEISQYDLLLGSTYS